MIIGISGLAGSGKDTAADFLVHDFGFVKISFADPMKRAVADWFGWDEERLWGPSEKRNAADPRFTRVDRVETEHGAVETTTQLSARRALQFLGTEVGRELYRDVWVEYAIRQAKRLLESDGWDYARAKGVFRSSRSRPGGVVIPDMRFRNEMDAIKATGGKLVRVVRPGAGLEGSAAAHRSEVEMGGIPDDDFDYVIENTTGSLEGYRKQIDRLFRAIYA